MSSCITLKEARRLLTTAAYNFAPIIKEALEVWLQTTDGLPKHLQLPSTAAATELVQAALQQAPWPMQQHEPRQLAWLQNHLPGISTAILDSFCRQLETTSRRLTILQSLPIMPEGTQVSAFLQAARAAYLLYHITACVLYHVLPVTVLCSELATRQGKDQGTQTPHGHDQPHRLQQGNKLISRVGAGLQGRQDIIRQVAIEYSGVLEKLGAQVLDTQSYGVLAGTRWQRDADVILLGLLAELPPKHDSTAQFYQFFDGRSLHKDSLTEQTLNRVQTALCRALAQPALLSNLQTIGTPELTELYQLVCSLKVTARQLQAAGMPAAQAKQLLSKLQGAYTDIRRDVTSGPQHSAHSKPTSSSTAADSSSSSVLSGSGQAADTGASAGYEAADGDDSWLADMKALLRQMYGCTIQQHSPETQSRSPAQQPSLAAQPSNSVDAQPLSRTGASF